MVAKRISKRMPALVAGLTVAALLAACGGGGSTDGAGGKDVTIEFMQWWEPELPSGSFSALIERFETENPGIKVELLSGPYSATKEQIIAGAAANTIPDVVGLDGAWVYDLVKQGAITDLTALMEENGYDSSQLASQVQLDNKTYMIPVVNFVYPMFTNTALLSQAGIDTPPTNRTEFLEAATKISQLGDNIAGWALPLSLEIGNGVQNDIMPWVWAGGGSMLTDAGQPNVADNPDMTSGLEFVQELWDAGAVSPGAFNMKEQDKVEEFVNGRSGMMISSLAHVNMIRKENPELEFTVTAMPAPDGFTGARGINDNSWGIGVAENSEHKAEAFKLVEFLLSESVNSELSTIANGFPGNKGSIPDFSESDPLFEQAFAIYQDGYPANQFVGLPVAEELMRLFATQIQANLNGDQSVAETLATTQSEWDAKFN